MKKYKEYMDGVEVSDTLHRRLLELDPPKKRPTAWRRYAAVAAALVLVAGVGAWGLTRGMGPTADQRDPEAADAPVPDIAILPPDETPDAGAMTNPLGGYEVLDGEMAAYYFLPYISYGMSDGSASQMALDWDVPYGSTQRDLTHADISALFGGAENLSVHLGWGGYELSGWAVWNEDGSLWGMWIDGYAGALDHFELALCTGNHIPPTCIWYGDGEVNHLWGVAVTGWGHDGQNGCSRRVEFLDGVCGYRFDLTATDTEQAEQLVSRLARWVIMEQGLDTDAVPQDGAVLSHPWEDPSYVDPGYNDGGVDEPCHDPDELADPSYTAPLDPTAGSGEPEAPVPPDLPPDTD